MNGEWLARWCASRVERRTDWWNGTVSDTGTSWWAARAWAELEHRVVLLERRSGNGAREPIIGGGFPGPPASGSFSPGGSKPRPDRRPASGRLSDELRRHRRRILDRPPRPP